MNYHQIALDSGDMVTLNPEDKASYELDQNNQSNPLYSFFQSLLSFNFADNENTFARIDFQQGGNILAQNGFGKILFADTPGSTSTTASVSVNGSISDVLEIAGDQDWFSISLTAGQRYIIALDGSGSSPLSDPLVRLLDSHGNQLALNDDGGSGFNSSLSYTATTTGIYYISAQAYSTEIGDYTLSVSEAPPIGLRTIDGIAHFLTDEFSTRSAYASTNITYNLDGLAAGAQTLALRALDAWAEIVPFNFVSAAAAVANMVFQNTEAGASNDGSSSGGFITGSIINISSNWNGGNLNFDSYTYQTFLHEIGHALGLGHAGPYNGSATYGIDNVYLNDSWAYTVMSYFSQSESSFFGNERFVLGPQISDILAIQDLYGANTTTRNGDTVYGFNSTEAATDVHNFVQFSQAPSLSIYDTGGIDTLDFSGYSQDQYIDLNAEAFSDVNGIRGVISISRGSIIENAIGGSGIDVIFGNAVSNILTGNGGDDILNGGDGADTLNGDAGFDIASYADADTGVTISLYTGMGNNGHAAGDTYTGLEGLTGSAFSDVIVGRDGASDTLRGGDGSDGLRGNGGDDMIFGEGGDDLLFSGFGADQHDGGAGTDTVLFNLAGAGVIVNLTSGTGFVGQAEGDTYINIENVIGTAFGDFVVGSETANRLDGRAGNDVLDGRAGADVLIGGNNADRFIFAQGYGTDRIEDFTDTDGDVIDVRGYGFADFATLQAMMFSSGADTVINFGGGDALRLVGVDINDLDASDFMLNNSGQSKPQENSIDVSDSFDFGGLIAGVQNDMSMPIESDLEALGPDMFAKALQNGYEAFSTVLEQGDSAEYLAYDDFSLEALIA